MKIRWVRWVVSVVVLLVLVLVMMRMGLLVVSIVLCCGGLRLWR